MTAGQGNGPPAKSWASIVAGKSAVDVAAATAGVQKCPALPAAPAPPPPTPAQKAAADIVSGAVMKPAAAAAVARYKDAADVLGKTAKDLAPKLAKLESEELYKFMKKQVDDGLVPQPRNVPIGGQPQYIFEYPDGTVVRIKPNGDFKRPGPTYSIEIKGDETRPDQGPQSIAFKVDPGGNPVPKGPGEIAIPAGLTQQQQVEYVDTIMDAGHRVPTDKPKSR